MVQFHPLTVVDLHKTIRDAVVVTLKPEDEDAFANLFLASILPFAAKIWRALKLRRSYSICAPGADRWQCCRSVIKKRR